MYCRMWDLLSRPSSLVFRSKKSDEVFTAISWIPQKNRPPNGPKTGFDSKVPNLFFEVSPLEIILEIIYSRYFSRFFRVKWLQIPIFEILGFKINIWIYWIIFIIKKLYFFRFFQVIQKVPSEGKEETIEDTVLA